MPPASGLIVDLLGFLTGTALYVMLVFMVWREAAASRTALWASRGRLPFLTGLCGLLWNVGALASFGARLTGSSPEAPLVLVAAFGALGFLPALVVHSLLYGRETAAGRSLSRRATVLAYALSASAAVLHARAAIAGDPVPSRAALWLLTTGFIALTTTLIFFTRQQPFGRRGVWVAALAIFAVSAFHFSRHVGDETWWVELATHHASLLLALAILIQDYRFGFADLFLKNALALLGLMTVSLAVLTGLVNPLVRWQGGLDHWDPRALTAIVVLWAGTAVTFPLLRRLAGWVVDRAVFKRPDYQHALARFARAVDAAETEDEVLTLFMGAVAANIDARGVTVIDDPVSATRTRLALTGSDVRDVLPGCALLLRVQTVEAPHRAVAIASLPAGRRLLSDDLRWLEAMVGLAARRIDALRVAQERFERNVREQEMHRLATEAELRALRAQLNPHFLFNALTTIGYLIGASPSRALDTLLRLTSVLRSVLRRTSADFCTLGEEIEFVEAYLEIERARFEDRLRVVIDIPADLRNEPIPTLLLQPLVENAIKHGIAPHRRGGEVRVSVSAQHGRMWLIVADTGAGFDAARHEPARDGVGLRSLRERLRAHYGLAATVAIDSEPGVGTRVEVALPLGAAHVVTRRRRA